MSCREQKLKQILELTRGTWDQPNEKAAVRNNFRKVCECRTLALGAEVYSSFEGEKVFCHTCKSKLCPSCGNRATNLWQRNQWVALPDIPFVGLVLTMPDLFWPVLQAHRRLQHDLPAIGAAAIEAWAWNRYQVKLYVVVIQHTFGGHLNYNPHLHIMVSGGGLSVGTGEWKGRVDFDRRAIMSCWRLAVTAYLDLASRKGLITENSVSPRSFREEVAAQATRDWNIHITSHMSKRHFLGYAGRYIRRPPISQRRILRVTPDRVTYQTKDTKTKTLRENTSSIVDFVRLLSQHVGDHYGHSMRYFGLLSPRLKNKTAPSIYCKLGINRRPLPKRLSWRFSLIRDFGTDPLLDSHGNQMRWVRRLSSRSSEKVQNTLISSKPSLGT